MTASNPILFNNINVSDPAVENAADLEAILHPGRVFARPMDVVHHPTLSLPEKRAILASWASDACAVEAAPALRVAPGAKEPVRFDEVMDALSALDQINGGNWQSGVEAKKDRRTSRGSIWRRGRSTGSNDGSVPLE
jgi:hypothetical protein